MLHAGSTMETTNSSIWDLFFPNAGSLIGILINLFANGMIIEFIAEYLVHQLSKINILSQPISGRGTIKL